MTSVKQYSLTRSVSWGPSDRLPLRLNITSYYTFNSFISLMIGCFEYWHVFLSSRHEHWRWALPLLQAQGLCQILLPNRNLHQLMPRLHSRQMKFSIVFFHLGMQYTHPNLESFDLPSFILDMIGSQCILGITYAAEDILILGLSTPYPLANIQDLVHFRVFLPHEVNMSWYTGNWNTVQGGIKPYSSYLISSAN